MLKKITIIGFFAFNTDYNGGQENKTRAIGDLLKNKYGEERICSIDTLNWKKHPFKLFYKTYKEIKKSDIVIMLPARNGVKVFSQLLLLFKKKNTKIFYSVIGGWLPELTDSNVKLKRNLIKFDGIWVETNSMKKSLNKQGFENITIIPNFKKIVPIKKSDFNENFSLPYKICTFSRVLKEKGIEDAISVVEEINQENGKNIFELDIYGRIDNNYKEKFFSLEKSFPSYIKYMGVVPYNNTVNTLKNYFLLLFPTHYRTEGIPGTIIDAYASGVPILSAKWVSYDDIVINKKTGISFEQLNNYDLKKQLLWVYKNPQSIINMKTNCLKEFNKYTEEYAFDLIEKEILK